MKRLMFTIVAVGVMLNAGVSLAQEDAPQMPEKVQKVLEYRIGTWSYVIVGKDVKATLVYSWAPGKTCIIGDIRAMVEGEPFFSSHIIGWDGVSEYGIHMNMVSKIENWSDQTKILSNTTEEGTFSGFMSEKKYSGRSRLVKQDEDHMTAYITDRKLGNESISDMKIEFTRVKDTTLQDFKEFCRLHEGRWVSDITWATDWPGFGKKGETVTAYMQGTLSEDGNALIMKFNGGKGSWTELYVYDADARRINSTWAMSSGGMGHSIIRKNHGKWIGENIEIEADGTKAEFTLTIIFGDNGNELTIKGGGTIGNEVLDIPGDIWHRLNK